MAEATVSDPRIIGLSFRYDGSGAVTEARATVACSVAYGDHSFSSSYSVDVWPKLTPAQRTAWQNQLAALLGLV